MRKLALIFSLLFPLLAYAQQDDWADDWGDDWKEESSWFHGFVDISHSEWLSSGYGSRPLQEIFWRLERDDQWQWGSSRAYADVVYDGVTNEATARWRALNILFSPTKNSDIKLGRQILTWGTGDLVFINDLFPKDWRSFFSGRDDEHLKAPSDALKWSIYGSRLNLDMVFTPEFDSDRFLTGERLSFYLPSVGGIGKPQAELKSDTNQGDDWEFALRLYGTQQGREWAVYGYRGFFKPPSAQDDKGNLLHSRLNSIGASVRQPLVGGLWNIETGYYQSVDDRRGDNPLVANSQVRWLMGYEKEVVKDLTLAGQVYIEKVQQHRQQQATHPTPRLKRSEWYELLTFRLTHMSFQQNLKSSMFVFYSPDEQDWHLRLSESYRLDDSWTVTAGVYLFGGEDKHSFLGQLQQSDSLWLRLRYSY